MPQDPIRHFGVLIPSTNTTGEIEYSRLLPPQWQAHYARMATSSVNKTVTPEVSDASPVRAPEWSLSELADRLVDTGMPWKTPAPMLAADCATDSWFRSMR